MIIFSKSMDGILQKLLQFQPSPSFPIRASIPLLQNVSEQPLGTAIDPSCKTPQEPTPYLDSESHTFIEPDDYIAYVDMIHNLKSSDNAVKSSSNVGES